MSDTITPVSSSVFGISLRASSTQDTEEAAKEQGVSELGNVDSIDIAQAVQSVDDVLKTVTDIALSFSIEEDLSRLVVAVRAVGSDEIIRQFPPEEFLTVAKHIASQNPDMIDEDYLKGILFDQYT